MFVQADGRRDRSQGGLGIGLSLVKTLVEMHGGTIAARSDGPGTGSEFVVRLPVPPETTPDRAEPDRGERSQAVAEPPRRRILVVDDNVDAATSLATAADDGSTGRRCGSPTTARRPSSWPRSSAPRSSCWTSACRGWTATRWPGGCGGEPDLDGTLLVALTGWGQEADRRRSREAGFDHHLVKPVDPEVLCRLLVSPVAEV